MAGKTDDNNGGTGGQQSTSSGGASGESNTEPKDGAGAKEGEAGTGGGEGDDSLDESTLDPKVQAQLKKLRKEAAGYRTKLNATKTEFDTYKQKVSKAIGDESDEVPADEKIAALTAQSQAQSVDNAILSLAVENNVSKDGLKYFRFLVAEATQELQEGEELSDEKISEIVAEVHAKHAPKTTTTSVTTKKAPNPNASDEITLDKFVSMGMGEKTTLYQKNPELYNSLVEQAKKAKRLI